MIKRNLPLANPKLMISQTQVLVQTLKNPNYFSGTNGFQAKLLGCRRDQRPPTGNGVRHAIEVLRSGSAEHFGQDESRQDIRQCGR